MEISKGKRLQKYVKDYIVFDLETTGISQVSDSIIEISAIKVRNNIENEVFSTLVNPNRHIPSGATAVNGITDDMVADAPVIADVMVKFIKFIGDDILVGHNIHTFDMNFICRAAEFLGAEIKNDYIDTLYMARKCLPELSHHKLTDVSGYFNISTQGAHRALQDCRMNQLCYEMLGKLLPQCTKIEMICPSCGGDLFKRSGKFGEFYGCGNFPACRFTKKI